MDLSAQLSIWITVAVCLALLGPEDAVGDMVSNFANEKNQACKLFVVSERSLFAGSFSAGSFGGGYQLDQIFLSIVSVGLEMTNLKSEVSSPSGWSIGDKSFLLVDGTLRLDDVCVPYLKVDVFPAPEPSSVAILGMGVVGFSVLLRRRRPV